MSRKSLHLLLLSGLLSAGCHHSEIDEKMGCDCDGIPAYVITEEPAQIVASAGKYINLKDAVNNVTFTKTLFLCDTTTLKGLPASDVGEYNYLVSGNLRPPCITNGIIYVWSLELTAIKKSN
ncbi:hypothetical protein [Dyadobacter sp. NIV53]|uniref:hypothetical protein n=1 Tax=Dyadobacter sp. NIV53 TaxID=2861765 RepID=UPI001C87866C|nr:hypothetical protein [Dyadobacter sp. NIV53]